jgi:LAS superfamily LD-carboxypeptidase LdcB
MRYWIGMQCLCALALGMKKKVQKKEKKKAAEKKQPPEQEAEKTSAYDFGGLPERNLKKNLGCA